MVAHSRIVWSEGLFVRPQHFQQETRHLEAVVDGRVRAVAAYRWGLSEFMINPELTAVGKVGLLRCCGVMPDGTLFSIPDEDPMPSPLDLLEGMVGQRIFIALPLGTTGYSEFVEPGVAAGLARYEITPSPIKDNTQEESEAVDIRVGRPRLRLMLESEDRSAFTCLPVAAIKEVRADRRVVLDEHFIPPAVDCTAISQLNGFVNEVSGLLHHRGEAVVGRMGRGGQGGVADVSDFMLLQLVNRLEPRFRHLASVQGLHPETLYDALVQVVGELATFTSTTRRPDPFPTYRHDDLTATFQPVMRALRMSLSTVLEQTAIPLELQEGKFGIRTAAIGDRQWIENGKFILAVSAAMAGENLRRNFPQQVKIGSVEKIRQLISLQLPGIPLHPLPIAPRELPYHANFTYFELGRDSSYWNDLLQSGGFAIHIAGDFPDLQLEFWVIRSR